jgi:hypothetical protein
VTSAQGIVVAALATLVAALLGAYVGAQVHARREHSAWLRDKRFAVCRAYLVSHDWADLEGKVGAKRRKDLPPPADYYAEFELLGLGRISEGAQELDRLLSPLRQMVWENVPFDERLAESAQREHDHQRAAWVADVRRTLGVESL